MNEKIGVKLVADVKDFFKGVERATSEASKRAKVNIGVEDIKIKQLENELKKLRDFKPDTAEFKKLSDEFEKQIQNIDRINKLLDEEKGEGWDHETLTFNEYIDNLKRELEVSQQITEELAEEMEKIRLTEAQINKVQRLENQLELAKAKASQTVESIKEVGSAVEKTGSSLQDGFNKGLKSAKRFTMSLFGVHSVYRMLSRASSSYLAQDQETSQKIQSAWVGLGSIFAPLLQTIANFTIKAVKYINVFIKALTGTDFLANAMAKSMNKASKSAGKLSKTLAGFDELTNLDDDAGGASVDTSWVDSFKEVELDNNVVNWLQKIGTAAKELWDKYLSPLWENIKKGAKITFEKVLKPVFEFFKEKVLNPLIDGFKILYEKALKPLYDFLVDLFTPAWEILKDLFIKIHKNVIEPLAKVISTVLKGAFETLIIVVGLVIDVFSWLWNKILEPIVSWLYKTFKPAFDTVFGTIKSVIDGLKRTLGGIIDFIVGVFTGNWRRAWQGVKDIFGGIWDTIKGIVKGAVNIMIDIINALIKGINKLVVGGLNKLLSAGKVIGIDVQIPKIPKIPKLAVGTDYVPNDMLAQIHEGEAVVPKKFNSDEYFSRLSTNNSQETNKLLEQLIDRVEQIEINPYTTIKDVGQASQNYRNLQSRIIGEELI